MRYLRNREKTIVALALLTALVLASCSGSGTGNSGSISGVSLSPLVVADNVSVVDPQQPSGGGSLQPSSFSLISALVFGGLSPASDYSNDRVTVYVNERSVDTFGTINDILCSVKQTRYDAMINRGPYLALVDKNLCSSNRTDASSAGQASTNQSSGSTMPNYELWTIDSSRTSASSSHIVRIWVHEKPTTNSPTGKLIIARMVIKEGVATAPPYGIFKIDFKAVDPLTFLSLFTGFLAAERDSGTGKILLKFATEDKDSYQIEKATLDKAANGTTGAGTALTLKSIPGQAATTDRFDIAYDADNFLRTDNTGLQTCLDRKNYDVSAWRYGLYDMAGSRVARNSGFPIRAGAAYGWVGYWGLWLQQGVTVNNGDTVYKHDYSNNTETPYAIVKSGGKLKKHTKQSTTLGNIKNIPLDWWDSAGQVNYRVIWNDMSQVFQKVAQQDPADWTWGNITPTTLSLSALNSTELYFWSQSLGGQARVKLAGCIGTGPPFNCVGVPTTATPVVYYAEDIVYPTDAVPATLACFDMCPDSTVLSSPTSSATFTNPYRTDIISYQTVTPGLATYASYTFTGSSSSMTLTDANGAVALTVANANFPWGIGSGPLFDPTTINLNALVCDWDPTKTCGWQAWSALSEFYTWETGPNVWNQFTALVDGGGTFVRFDPPLHVQYTHQAPSVDPTPADIKYNGVTFFLEYSGFGELQGIPGKCVNLDTGADADCGSGGSGSSIRWVPELTIPDKQGPVGTEVYTEVTGPGPTQYFVKALEKEERMTGVNVNTFCTGKAIPLTTTKYTLPSMSSWDAPVIGTEPVITSSPAVVGGVIP